MVANSVLLPLKKFRCFDARTLYQGVQEIDWTYFFASPKSLAIDANVYHPQIRNGLFAAQVVKDAICDQLISKKRWRPDVDLKQPDIPLNLYIHQTNAVLSFDTSGLPLNKRGYRKESVPAPIKETLAAAILKLAGYCSSQVFLDPCCGCGTLLIEAALIASKTPPGFLRKTWGFMHHPQFEEEKWGVICNQLNMEKIPLKSDHFFATDCSFQAVEACQQNLAQAGIEKAEVSCTDFQKLTPRIAPNFLITNPPHGKRLEESKALYPLYRSLGKFIKTQCAKPAKAAIFVGGLELTKQIGLAAKKRHILDNGGVDSRLLEFEIY